MMTGQENNDKEALLYEFLFGYNDRVETFDQLDEKKGLINSINYCMATFSKVMEMYDKKAINNCKTEKEQGENLIKTQNLPIYKDLQKNYNFLNNLLSRVDELYQGKNRLRMDNIKLRAKIAELKKNI